MGKATRFFCVKIFAAVMLLLMAWPLLPASAAEKKQPHNPHAAPLEHLREFTRLARELSAAEEYSQAEFARVALSQMILVYQEEAERARQRGKSKKSRSNAVDRARWAHHTDRYATRLQAMLTEIDEGAVVRVNATATGLVTVQVNARGIAVSPPQINKQADFEQQILDQFCGYGMDCREAYVPRAGALSAADPLAGGGDLRLQTGAPTAPKTAGEWRFDGGGAVYRLPQGLAFVYADANNLNERQAACRQLLTALNTLVAEIQALLVNNSDADLNELNVQTQPILQLQFGEQVSLPVRHAALMQQPQVVQQVQLWLRERVLELADSMSDTTYVYMDDHTYLSQSAGRDPP